MAATMAALGTETKKKVEGETQKTLIFSKTAPKISFEQEGDKLTVTIETENLHMRSVQKRDLDAYAGLYGDADVMGKFATGVPRDKAFVEGRINGWVDRWEHSNPFSSLAVFKRDEDDLAGQVVLGGGEEPKTSELAYLFNKKFWKKGIGKESVAAVVQHYAPELHKRSYKVGGQPFEAIVATAREDNIASWKILDEVGFVQDGTSEKFGAKRKEYRKKM
jgi:RimJ/RimL family protein N-acetyltransferase